MSAPHLSHSIPGRGEQESKSSPRQWVSNFLLTYPISPRSRTGCTFCTVLSTKQTQVQNIPLPPRLPQSLQGWIKHHFQRFCLFVNICKWPFPHAQRQNLPAPNITHASLSYISNNAETVCHHAPPRVPTTAPESPESRASSSPGVLWYFRNSIYRPWALGLNTQHSGNGTHAPARAADPLQRAVFIVKCIT